MRFKYTDDHRFELIDKISQMITDLKSCDHL